MFEIKTTETTETVNQITLYLSGPMTGLPEYNYPEFFRVATLLESMGYKVINPANTGVQDGWIWRDYLKKDLVDLLQNNVTSIILLEGWDNSKGAKLEIQVGNAVGIPHYELSYFLSKKLDEVANG